MKKKHLLNYCADRGSVVVNGLWLSNGIGDGTFGVFFTQEYFESDIWVDFSEVKRLEIKTYDVLSSSLCKEFVFTSKDLENSEAVGLSFDKDGNLIISKIF